MRGGGLRLAVCCDAGGDFALPITSSDHDLLFMLQGYAVFPNLQKSLVLHQENLHEVVEVAVEDSLGV